MALLTPPGEQLSGGTLEQVKPQELAAGKETGECGFVHHPFCEIMGMLSFPKCPLFHSKQYIFAASLTFLL